MELTMTTTDKARSINNTLRLIEQYRLLEKNPLSAGYRVIKNIVPLNLVAHVRDKWKHHDRDFGNFYLNLDYDLQFRFLDFFGLADVADYEFISKRKADPRGTIFDNPTGFLGIARQVLLYFNNTGIGDSNDKVRHHNLPENRYGNSDNWGHYLLSQNMAEQVRIIMEILNDK